MNPRTVDCSMIQISTELASKVAVNPSAITLGFRSDKTYCPMVRPWPRSLFGISVASWPSGWILGP